MPKTNKDIDTFLMNGELAIYPEWGMAQLSKYLHELDLVNKGVPFSELGIKERKAAQAPKLLTASGVFNFDDIDWYQNSDKRRMEVPPGSIAHLTLEGVMRSSSSLSTRGVNELVSDLRVAYAHPNIDGVIIEANTGGGESTAGQMLNAALQDAPKPVVVYAHLLASAGIMGTLPADEIIAAGDAAEMGSIGTYITLSKKFADWYNDNYQDVYADKSSKKNEWFREFLKGNHGPLKEYINRFNDSFTSQVEQYRNLKGNKEETLSGKMFMAKDARRRGLIDGIGSFEYAKKRLAANIKRKKSEK